MLTSPRRQPWGTICLKSTPQLTLWAPRPNGRGPIEADPARDRSTLVGRFPRPNGRGPIEARNIDKGQETFMYFRDLTVAAPLKQAA